MLGYYSYDVSIAVYAIGGAAAAILLILVLALIGIVLYCRRVKKRKRRLSQLQKSSVFNPSKLENKQDPYNYNEDHYISIRRSPLRVSTYSTLQAVTKKKPPNSFDRRHSDQNGELSNHYLNEFEMTNIPEETSVDPIGSLARKSTKIPKYEMSSCQEADTLPGNSHYANITFSAPPSEQNTLRRNKTSFSSQPSCDNEKLEFLPPPLESFLSDDDKDMYYPTSHNTPPISPMTVDNYDCNSSRQGEYYKTPVIHPIYDTVSEDQNFLPSPTFQNDNYLIRENLPAAKADLTYDLNVENGNIPQGNFLEPNHYKIPRQTSNSNFIFPPPPSPTDFNDDLYNSNVYCEMQLGSDKNDNYN
ncbi:uncharacterized protein LOC106875887 [Octopus bimaculoides]|uniref:Uncharacterized protein n=1 Tax=Octopus bimaculoides TaxID=37653 RepID=A0A0L8GMI8_OCTBM|nr:uncharacterized protein LOC106875887 [Octopus bimaculoides]|eukprot:XP_014779676.1 PREDICTED: uncharacterized protein LOC106875887 [Octopus bimaculoides]